MVGVKAVKGVFGFGASLFDRVFDKFFLRKLAVAVEVGVVKFGLDRSLQLFLNFFRGSRRFYGKFTGSWAKAEPAAKIAAVAETISFFIKSSFSKISSFWRR